MIQCITSTRFTMLADILRQDADDSSVPLSQQGHHEVIQDQRTGAIKRVWVPVLDDSKGDMQFSIPCEVKSIVSDGIRVAGTTERYDGKGYDNVDFAQMSFPKGFVLSKRDRVTNVRSAKTEEIIWVEEELDIVDGQYPATVFDVLGINPITVPLLGWTENRALLARADLSAI